MTMKQILGAFAIASAFVATLPAQGDGNKVENPKDQSQRIEQLEKKNAKLEQQNKEILDRLDKVEGRTATGSAGTSDLRNKGELWDRSMQEGEVGKPSSDSLLGEKVRINGRLEFEAYDSVAERRNLGNYTALGGNQYGLNNGAWEMRIRRFELGIGMDVVEDVSFESKLVLDPVIQDQNQDVQLEEAYFRFGNFFQHVFDVEDPSHTYIRAGRYLTWQRSFAPQIISTWSMSATAFYRYRVTGLEIGGNFEEGFFYSLGLDNGRRILDRDAGINKAGSSPMLIDRQLDGALQNHKDVVVGLGIKNRMDDPKIDYRLGLSYRYGKLSSTEVTYLNSVLGASYDGGDNKSRFGALAGMDWDFDAWVLSVDGEFWLAKDGNAKRDVSGLGVVAALPLEGTIIENRPFFTKFSVGYRIGYLHQTDGIANPSSTVNALWDDRVMHTGVLSLELTRNATVFLEVNNWKENSVDVSNTEWTLMTRIDF